MGTTLIATSTPRMTYKIGMRAGIDSFSDKMARGTGGNVAVQLVKPSLQILLWIRPWCPANPTVQTSYESMKSGHDFS